MCASTGSIIELALSLNNANSSLLIKGRAALGGVKFLFAWLACWYVSLSLSRSITLHYDTSLVIMLHCFVLQVFYMGRSWPLHMCSMVIFYHVDELKQDSEEGTHLGKSFTQSFFCNSHSLSLRW